MKTIGRKIDFVGKCIAKLTAYFSVTILNYIFTPFIQIKFFQKHLLALKTSDFENLSFFSNIIQNKEITDSRYIGKK